MKHEILCMAPKESVIFTPQKPQGIRYFQWKWSTTNATKGQLFYNKRLNPMETPWTFLFSTCCHLKTLALMAKDETQCWDIWKFSFISMPWMSPLGFIHYFNCLLRAWKAALTNVQFWSKLAIAKLNRIWLSWCHSGSASHNRA